MIRKIKVELYQVYLCIFGWLKVPNLSFYTIVPKTSRLHSLVHVQCTFFIASRILAINFEYSSHAHCTLVCAFFLVVTYNKKLFGLIDMHNHQLFGIWLLKHGNLALLPSLQYLAEIFSLSEKPKLGCTFKTFQQCAYTFEVE